MGNECQRPNMVIEHKHCVKETKKICILGGGGVCINNEITKSPIRHFSKNLCRNSPASQFYEKKKRIRQTFH